MCASRLLAHHRNEIQRQSSNEDGSELQQEIGKLKSECTSSYVEGVNWTSNRRQCELQEYLLVGEGACMSVSECVSTLAMASVGDFLAAKRLLHWQKDLLPTHFLLLR